tara:strand:- start:2994 stop:5378 length:2385 start_codon:yes stop_codon:yes gene_type:complete
MPNLVGIGNSQVPTNAMLGGLAYQDSVGEINIDEIKAKTADTAVDVFVYDTRKDSDGGAWRKRTSHTSWYNEGVSQQRGARKEFPAVAILVAYNNGLIIYDGDDPNLPMWMEIWQYQNNSSGNTNWWGGSGNATSVAAINGTVVLGGSGTRNLHFINDRMSLFYTAASGNYTQFGGISDRNIAYTSWSASDEYYAQLLNAGVNDVAMTILPNAPIDANTGLPIPTIAVATDGGLSIINHSVEVFHYTRSGGTEFTGSVAFDENNDLIVSWGTVAAGWRHISRFTEPFATDTSFDTGQGYLATDLGLGGSAAGGSSGAVKISNNGRAFAIDYDGKVSDRLGLLDLVDGSTSKSLGAFIDSSANSGWCVGDITRAWLCSTDTTNVTGSQKITNGTFDSNVNNWTNASNGTKSHVSGQLRVTSGAGGYASVYQAVTLVVGTRYTVEGYVHAGTALNGAEMFISTSTAVNSGSASGASELVPYGNWKSIHITFTATATTMYVHCQPRAYNANEYSSFDNVSLREAEDDMSINKKGICVYGTVPKQVVASGAELVSYGPFSNSNYLDQLFDEDFEYGTGDFSVSLWFKTTGTGIETFLRKGIGGSDYGAFEAYMHTDGGAGRIRFVLKDNDGSSYTICQSAQSGWNDGYWHHYVGVRQGALLRLYLDGRLNNSAETDVTHSVAWASMSSHLTVGRSSSAANPATNTYLTLVKIAGDAPTDDQVKKIYNDEKSLFEPNAKCTLYGSSNTITAVAYDDSTDTVYAGTSAGRSDFSGLTRINNTTTAVTTAIAVSNELVAEQ